MVSFNMFFVFCILSILFYISLCFFIVKVFEFYNNILIKNEVQKNDRYNKDIY